VRSECESCCDLAGCWRLKPLPEPVLQCVEADETGIRRQQCVLMTSVLRPLPGELHGVDEDQSRRCPATSAVEREWFSGEAGYVSE
jgi:hypothetical protein